MIEINLAPPEVRKRKKKSSLAAKFNIPMEVIVGSAGGLLVLLVLIHFGLMGVNLTKKLAYNRVKAKWNEMAPSKAKVDQVMQEMRSLQSQYDAIKGITQDVAIQWSEKLNIISDNLPKGVWLKRVDLTDEAFLLDGSAISKKSNEMINVHSFIAALKGQERFLDKLVDLDLGSIQSRYIKDVEVADFVIKSGLKK